MEINRYHFIKLLCKKLNWLIINVGVTFLFTAFLMRMMIMKYLR